MNDATTCSVEGCDNVVRARSWCNKHWKRWRKHGDPQHAVKSYFRDPEASFLARTEQDGTCLVWTGGRISAGYGLMAKRKLAHRYAWERVNGPIPEGMDIDHRYRCDRLCCEVSHLRLASRSQNLWNRVGPIPGRIEDLPRNVYLDRKSGSYFVKITRNGERHHIGTFATVEEADAAAENARKDLHGAYYAPA